MLRKDIPILSIQLCLIAVIFLSERTDQRKARESEWLTGVGYQNYSRETELSASQICRYWYRQGKRKQNTNYLGASSALAIGNKMYGIVLPVLISAYFSGWGQRGVSPCLDDIATNFFMPAGQMFLSAVWKTGSELHGVSAGICGRVPTDLMQTERDTSRISLFL